MNYKIVSFLLFILFNFTLSNVDNLKQEEQKDENNEVHLFLKEMKLKTFMVKKLQTILEFYMVVQ